MSIRGQSFNEGDANAARFERLPKWAQQVIERQQGTINTLRKELDDIAMRSETDASFESYGLDNERGLPKKMYLPRGMVTFHLGTDRYNRAHDIRISVEKNIEGRRSIRVNSMVGPLYVEPQASNVVAITSLRSDHMDDES